MYRKLKILGTQVKRKIRRSSVYRNQLDLLIDQPLGGFKRKIWMPVPLRRSPASTPACVYCDDIARFYSRFCRSKIIDADLFVDCFFEANDDPFACHAIEWYFVHSRAISIEVPWGINVGAHVYDCFHMGNIQGPFRHLRKI